MLKNKKQEEDKEDKEDKEEGKKMGRKLGAERKRKLTRLRADRTGSIVLLGVFFVTFVVSLWSPVIRPAAAAGAGQAQNPPFSVIAQKLEAIARQKGIPSVLLKAIAFKESSWRQWDDQGNPLLSSSGSHPAIGIMQIASYNDKDTATVQRLKNDIDFNIATGADLLNQKWNFVPKIGDGERNKLENWYFALWAYNNWSRLNNPNYLTQSQGQSGQTAQTGQNAQTSQNGQNPATGGTSIPGQAYQDKVIAICAQPPAPIAPYVTAVNITKIPAASLPSDGVPAASGIWPTPQPVHYGDLQPSLALNRLVGNDRIDTALQEAALGWPGGSSAVLLARADDFPDALAGVPLAAQLDAPILLTSPHSLDNRVAAALNRLHPRQVYLLGGEGALGQEISQALSQLGWNINQQIRLGGVDRYATAAKIAQSMTNPSHAAVLATGDNFPDALSVAAAAGRIKMPLLLANSASLPQVTFDVLKTLNLSQLYVIGGEGVLSKDVLSSVQTRLNLSAGSVIRLAGADRYATMAAVAGRFSGTDAGMDFATGDNFPDALTGAALAVHQHADLVLLPSDPLSNHPELKGYIAGQWPSLTSIYILGGEGAVPAARVQELQTLSQ